MKKFHSLKISKFPFFMYSLIYPKMFLEFLKLKKDDVIVHSHSFPSFHSYLALFFHKKFRNVTVTPHFDVDDLKRFTTTFFAKLAFEILRYFVNKKNVYLSADTRKEKDFYVSILGFDGYKIFVAPNGVNIEEFDSILDGEVYGTKKQYNLGETFNVLFAGRVAQIKGIDVLIRAISELNNADIRLVIAGPDFGALTELKELSKKLGLIDKITFTGALERSRLCTLIKACDMFVLPSYGGESFGVVLAEAMACSKPVIGSRTGGIPEIIQEGENGFLIDVGAVAQLSKEINLLYQNKSLCETLGNRGREKVEKYYTWEKVASTYLKLWKKN